MKKCWHCKNHFEFLTKIGCNIGKDTKLHDIWMSYWKNTKKMYQWGIFLPRLVNKLKHNPLKKPTASNDGQVKQPKKDNKIPSWKHTRKINKNLKSRRDYYLCNQRKLKKNSTKTFITGKVNYRHQWSESEKPGRSNPKTEVLQFKQFKQP